MKQKFVILTANVRSYPKGEGANRHRVYVYHVTRSANIEDYIKFLEANNLVRREDNKPDGELCYFSKKILRAGKIGRAHV